MKLKLGGIRNVGYRANSRWRYYISIGTCSELMDFLLPICRVPFHEYVIIIVDSNHSVSDNLRDITT